MIRSWLPLLLVLVPGPALAAERRYLVTGFETVRVAGPFDVRVVSGGAPGASATGGSDALDALDVSVVGTTLVVRPRAGWGERGRAGEPGAPVITLSTPRLTGASVSAGGRLQASGFRAQRVSFQVTGSGTIAADGIATDQLNATLLGTGTMALSGSALQARLSSDGTGAIDAAALEANDLAIRLDGPGSVQARARYTAAVVSTGIGTVDVAGDAQCRVTAPAGGAVRCGPVKP